jgi:hypothetical protein
LKKNQHEQQHLFKLIHILTTNKIRYVTWWRKNFDIIKKLDFLELILESWIFFMKNATLIRTIILIIFINILHSKGWGGGSIGDVDFWKRTF